MERVLSAFRYLSLSDHCLEGCSKEEEAELKKIRSMSWPQFVDSITQHDSYSEAISEFWTPSWYNCGLCLPSLRPKYILHLEKINKESQALVQDLGLKDHHVSFPKINQNQDGLTLYHNREYYKQLTKNQVRKSNLKDRIKICIFRCGIFTICTRLITNSLDIQQEISSTLQSNSV